MTVKKLYVGDIRIAGIEGKSAYQSWLEAGHTGTEEDFLDSLKGEDGEQGEKGDDGSPGIETASVTVDATTGTPSATATITNKNLALAFSGLKGEAGAAGAAGATGPQGPKGDQGNSGYSGAAGELQVVNNLSDGGATAALSAEMGKTLKEIDFEHATNDYVEITNFPNVGRIMDTGAVDSSLTNYRHTDYIPVGKYSIIRWVGYFPTQGVVYAYSGTTEASFMSILIQGRGSGAQFDETASMPSGAKYIRINMPYVYPTNSYVGLKSGLVEAVDDIKDDISDINDDITDLEAADTALGEDIAANASAISALQAADASINRRIIPFVGPEIAADNGVGGVTSSATNLTQGGLTTLTTWDCSKKWYMECVVKMIVGSNLMMIQYNGNVGAGLKQSNFRTNNSTIQVNVNSNGSGISVINQNAANLGLVSGNWYHFIVIYDGTYVYLYANGVLKYTSSAYTFVDILTGNTGWFMNPVHSPKLMRVGYLANDAVVANVVAAHYNGNNPFGYDSSVEGNNLLVEYLPENMLTTSIKNTAPGGLTVTYATEKTFSILTENPWAANISGAGYPAIIPMYVGQKYTDTVSGKTYMAIGNSTINDWFYYATDKDVAALKTQTKTVNGQTIWGSGDIEGGGSGGGGQYVSVVDKGAVGDGLTDDTSAIMTALEAARAAGKPLYFPNGTYLTRKGLVLTSGMHVIGEPGATLQNAAATIQGGGKCPYTTLTANAAAGATSVTVSDASKLVVGQEIVIWKSGSYTETMADITAISNKTITFTTERFTANGTNGGLLNAVSSGGYVLTDFALIKTIMTKAADNVTVEGITLKALSDINEPHIYTSSPISQTKQGGGESQKNFRVYGVTVYDSANDGISVQGTGESIVKNCRVYNQKHKGIHWGTSHDMILIEGNYVYGCGSAQYDNTSDYQGSGAMFFCSNNHRVIIRDNQIENCYRGIYGFNYQGGGEQDTDTIISGNIFKNCGKYGVFLRGGYRAVVTDNIFIDFNNAAIPLRTEAENTFLFTAGVISNNVFGNFGSSFAGPAMQITGSRNLVLTGNNVSGYVNNDASTVRSNCDITVASSSKVVVCNNIVDGTIDTSDAGNSNIITANNITG